MVWSSSLSKLNRWAGAWAQPGDRHPAPGWLSGAGPRWGRDPARRPRDGGLGSRGDLHSAQGRGGRGARRARRGAAVLVWEEARRQAAASPSPGHVAPPRAARGSGPWAARRLCWAPGTQAGWGGGARCCGGLSWAGPCVTCNDPSDRQESLWGQRPGSPPRCARDRSRSR